MANELRLVYNENFFADLEKWFQEKYAIQLDLHSIQNDTNWLNAGIRERQRMIGRWLNAKLNDDLKTITQIAEKLLHDFYHAKYPNFGLAFLCVPEILTFKKDISTDDAFYFIEKITQWVSCEFIVRDVLRKDFPLGMHYLKEFSKHEHPNVRRLASEGCRPNLPWEGNLHAAIEQPEIVFEVLENLMQDSSKFVQTSVANNLNDFSKIYPDIVLDWCKRFKGSSTSADWIIKKALRTLLKNGNKDALALIELSPVEEKIISSFEVKSENLRVRKFVTLFINICNATAEHLNLRVEYMFSYPLKDGKSGKKIFRIKDLLLNAGETITLSKKHSFMDLSTRKHLPGEYSFTLIINGKSFEKKSLIYYG